MAIRRLLDEQHRWQIIQIPIARDLHQPSLIPPLQRLHPRLRPLAIINLGPLIPRPQPIHLAIMMQHGMVVLDPIVQQQVRHLAGRLPPRRNRAPRRLPTEILQHLIRLVEDDPLLLEGHVARVLMAVPVQPDLVACVPDGGAFIGEGLERVARDEPGGFDVVVLEHLQQARRPDVAGE